MHAMLYVHVNPPQFDDLKVLELGSVGSRALPNSLRQARPGLRPILLHVIRPPAPAPIHLLHTNLAPRTSLDTLWTSSWLVSPAVRATMTGTTNCMGILELAIQTVLTSSQLRRRGPLASTGQHCLSRLQTVTFIRAICEGHG